MGGGGRGYGGWGRGRIYTYRYTVTTGMISALIWAAVRDILMFHNCGWQSHKTVSTDHNFWRERRAEADSNRGPSAYQPNALPLGQTGSLALTTLTRANIPYRDPPPTASGIKRTKLFHRQKQPAPRGMLSLHRNAIYFGILPLLRG